MLPTVPSRPKPQIATTQELPSCGTTRIKVLPFGRLDPPCASTIERLARWRNFILGAPFERLMQNAPWNWEDAYEPFWIDLVYVYRGETVLDVVREVKKQTTSRALQSLTPLETLRALLTLPRECFPERTSVISTHEPLQVECGSRRTISGVTRPRRAYCNLGIHCPNVGVSYATMLNALPGSHSLSGYMTCVMFKPALSAISAV